MRSSIQEMQWVLQAQCRDREALEMVLGSGCRHSAGTSPAWSGRRTRTISSRTSWSSSFRKLGGLDDPQYFRPWTFRIASRVAFRHLKKRRLWARRHDDDSQLDSLPTSEIRPSGDLLQRLLATDTISPASRAVLILHFEEELSLPEVAAILDIPLGTAKSRLAYGLTTLRKHMNTGGSPQAAGDRARRRGRAAALDVRRWVSYCGG